MFSPAHFNQKWPIQGSWPYVGVHNIFILDHNSNYTVIFMLPELKLAALLKVFPLFYFSFKHFKTIEQVFLLLCSHSDSNLVELGEETIKEDDRAILLEGGLSRSASVKFNSSSIKVNLMRFSLWYASSLLNFMFIYLQAFLTFCFSFPGFWPWMTLFY